MSRTRSTSRTIKVVVEPVDTGRHARASRGSRLTDSARGRAVQLEHLAYAVDQQSVGFAARLDADGHGRCAVCRDSRPSRHRISIKVTMRPRRLSTPAISAGANGTRVNRSGARHPARARMGNPNELPSDQGGDVFAEVLSAASFMVSSRCPADVGLFFERRNQSLPVEFGDIVVKSDAASAIYGLGRYDGRKGDDRQFGRPRIPRTASANWNPSMSGISMSVMATSKCRPSLSNASASFAQPTAVTE